MTAASLVLVTPQEAEPDKFAGVLADVLSAAAQAGSEGQPLSGSANPIAAVIIATEGDDRSLAEAARHMTPVVQQNGIAALVVNDTRTADRVGNDGVHCTKGIAELKTAIDRLKPDRIVGAGNLWSRHAAMEAAESGPDYLYFGKIGGDTFPDPHHRALALAQWAAEMLTIPVVTQAGCHLDSVAAAIDTGADHIAVDRAIWYHPSGPVAGIREALDCLSIAPAGRRKLGNGEPAP